MPSSRLGSVPGPPEPLAEFPPPVQLVPGSATSRLIDAMALRRTAADAPHTFHHATEHENAVVKLDVSQTFPEI